MSKHLGSTAMLSLLASCIKMVSEVIGWKHAFIQSLFIQFNSIDCLYSMSQNIGIQVNVSRFILKEISRISVFLETCCQTSNVNEY